MSIAVMTRVWELSPQKGSALLLTLAIADFADDDGIAWPGVPKLSFKIRMSERQTQRLIDWLNETGEIFLVPGQGRGNPTFYAVLTGFPQEKIIQVLTDRFDLEVDEAKSIATEKIKARQTLLAGKGDKLTPIKKGDKLSEKVTSCRKKVTKSTKKGDISKSKKSAVKPDTDDENEPDVDPITINRTINNDSDSVLNARTTHFKSVQQFWNQSEGIWTDDRFVYIGRKNSTYGLPASKWANPFKIDAEHSRDLVIAQYREHLLDKPALIRELPELRGKTLVCWCKPEACHGDVLVELSDLSDDDLTLLFNLAVGRMQPHVSVIYHWYYNIPTNIRPIGEPSISRSASVAVEIRDFIQKENISVTEIGRFVRETYPTYLAWSAKRRQQGDDTPTAMSLEHVKTYFKDWWIKDQGKRLTAPTITPTLVPHPTLEGVMITPMQLRQIQASNEMSYGR